MQIQSRITGIAVSCALLCGTAHACPVTYTFAGNVTGVGSGSPGLGTYGAIPIGTRITGTFTFDPANITANGNGISSISYGPVGSSTQGWVRGNNVVTNSPDRPIPTGYAFSSTAQVDGFTYSSSIPDSGAAEFLSTYSNDPEFQEYAQFYADEQQIDSNGRLTTSSLNIFNFDGSAAFGPAGMPKFNATSMAYGEFETMLSPSSGSPSYVGFNVTSLTPVTKANQWCGPSGQ